MKPSALAYLLRNCTLLAAFFGYSDSAKPRGTRVKRTSAVTALALSLIYSVAMAQERGGDAALGALSGALVLGPIGAVAGAVVGYTAGPSIARSWGLTRSGTARQGGKSVRREARVSPGNSRPAAKNQTGLSPTAQAPPTSPNIGFQRSAGPGPGVRHFLRHVRCGSGSEGRKLPKTARASLRNPFD